MIFESAIAASREKRVELLNFIAEKEILLRTLREDTDKSIAGLNVVTVGMSRLEVKYEAVTQRLLNEYGLFPDFNAIGEFDENSNQRKIIEVET